MILLDVLIFHLILSLFAPFSRRISESEMCYDVTRTVCTQTETTSEVEVCGVSFETVEQGGIAKSVQV